MNMTSTWIVVERMTVDEYDTDQEGHVKVIRENEAANSVLGIDLNFGMILIVDPTAIIEIGGNHFVKVTEDSVLAWYDDDADNSEV